MLMRSARRGSLTSQPSMSHAVSRYVRAGGRRTPISVRKCKAACKASAHRAMTASSVHTSVYATRGCLEARNAGTTGLPSIVQAGDAFEAAGTGMSRARLDAGTDGADSTVSIAGATASGACSSLSSVPEVWRSSNKPIWGEGSSGNSATASSVSRFVTPSKTEEHFPQRTRPPRAESCVGNTRKAVAQAGQRVTRLIGDSR